MGASAVPVRAGRRASLRATIRVPVATGAHARGTVTIPAWPRSRGCVTSKA
jgi:hypothetical protein